MAMVMGMGSLTDGDGGMDGDQDGARIGIATLQPKWKAPAPSAYPWVCHCLSTD